MDHGYLEEIRISLPRTAQGLISDLADFLAPVLRNENDSYFFPMTKSDYLPVLSFSAESDSEYTCAEFKLSSRETLSVGIKNITDTFKQSPYVYSHIELSDVYSRLSKQNIVIEAIDHFGFNLPWFNEWLHPAITDIRNRLKTMCLYHTYPTGEPWDFIIPASPDEIRNSIQVDYKKTRKPKFEIVSFGNSSTPLVQIDIALNRKYSELKALFPEALDDPHMHNIWIYLKNPISIDICLVLNEYKKGDWSSFFEGHRLL
jgi:hypothetical protein